MRKIELLAATAIALLYAAPAAAQDAGPAETAAASPQDEYGDDIVVTAQGRAQVVQDVPIAVAVVDAEAIENAGISDVRGLRQLTPSLQATTGQSAATGVVLSIRGIGTAGDNPGFEPAVGVFIDGVFRARAGLALSDLPELERVEVLRGPQGTLFGRNTSAGALSIVTAQPHFEFGGYAEASYGNFDEIEIKGGINAPVTDQFAVRLDGGYHKRDGYVTDVNSPRSFNNLDRWFARGQARYDSGDLTVRIIGDYSETDEQCCLAVNTAIGITGPAVEFLAGLAGRDGLVQPADPQSRRVAISPNRDFSERVKDWGVSAEIGYDLGDVSITSITAYRDWKAVRNQDIDFSGLDRAYRDGYSTGMRDFTQELRFQGTAFDGVLDFMVGGFYLNEELTLHDVVRIGTQGNQYVDALLSANTATLSPLAPNGFSLFGSLPGRPFLGNAFLASPVVQGAILANPALLGQFTSFLPSAVGGGQISDDYTVDTQAFGLFTHNIINISDALSVTLGLRYNNETKDISARLNAVNAPCSAISPGGAQSFFGQIFAANTALNGIRLLVCNPTVNPEFNGNYSDEHKESEFTGTARVAFKVSDDVLLFGGFSHGYKSGGYNLDRGGFDSRYFGGNGAQLSDLEFGEETVDSYEAGIKTNFSRQFQLNVTGFYQDFTGYQNLRFEGSSFVVRQYDEVISKGVEIESVIRPAPDLTVSLAYTYLSAIVHDPVRAPADNGNQLTNQPENVVTAAVTWTPKISDSVSALFHVDSRLNSDANTINDPAGIRFTTNDGYVLVNARVGLNFMDGRYGIEVYAENLFDTYYNITSFPVPEQTGAYAVYPAPPRFYGVKGKVRF
jgi:outer membrane receptor protein involved in Fe transport